MHVLFSPILAEDFGIQRDSLIIQAIAAGRHFPIGAFLVVLPRQPGFDIILQRLLIADVATADSNDTVRYPQLLENGFRKRLYLLKVFWRIFRQAIHHLLHFIKLMHAEHAFGIPTMRSCLFTETRTYTADFQWQFFFSKQLIFL